MTIVDTILKALAPVIPDKVAAGHHADLIVGRVNGRRPKDDSFYIYLGGLIGGGWGAGDNDGMSATIMINDGDTRRSPSEQVEAKFPLLVERYCLRPDSGGAGARFRGGLGTEQVVQARGGNPLQRPDRPGALPPLGPLWRAVGGRQWRRPPPLRRGRAPLPQRQGLQPGAQARRRVHPPIGQRRRLRPSLEREPARVESDVREGYVTEEAARDLYGVVVGDAAATAALPRLDEGPGVAR